MLVNLLKFCKDTYCQKRIWNYEKKKYKKYSNDTITIKKSVLFYERNIIILGHTIEKGLSHKNIKPKFGIEVAKELANNLNIYESFKDNNKFIFNNGVSIFQRYISENIKAGVPRKELPQINKRLYKYNGAMVGAYLTTGADFFKNSQKSFDNFAISRKTMRLYDQVSKKIPMEEIYKAIEIAINSPSACNRQAVRTYIITNKENIKYICEIQKGANGFGENADVMIIITSDLRFYTIAERRLPMYDCGLFSMSLLYAFYQQRIGCCILNGSLDKIQERKIAEKIEINSYEIISSLILLNKIDDQDSIMVAESQRRKIDEIINIRK